MDSHQNNNNNNNNILMDFLCKTFFCLSLLCVRGIVLISYKEEEKSVWLVTFTSRATGFLIKLAHTSPFFFLWIEKKQSHYYYQERV